MKQTRHDISFLGDTVFLRLKTLMQTLRDPQSGCPWDKEQTFKTIAPYTIEEAYEVADAIERGQMDDLKEELGDLMFQVVFHAQMADEVGQFNLDDICDSLVEKMVRRHPHIFFSSDQQTDVKSWEVLKAEERAHKQTQNNSPETSGILYDIPINLPALTRAEKLQKRAASVGFDWPDLTGVLDKITEEAAELAEAHTANDLDGCEDEMGDLLFAVTNLARKMGINPEKALRRTNKKFHDRFSYIETQSASAGQHLETLSLDEMEALWQAAKHKVNRA